MPVNSPPNGRRLGRLITLFVAATVAVAYIHVTFVQQSEYDTDMGRIERSLERIEEKIDGLR